MRNLFYRRGHNGRVYLSSMPTTRLQRWRVQFDDGRGPLFYAVAVLAAAGVYALLWLMLAVGVILE